MLNICRRNLILLVKSTREKSILGFYLANTLASKSANLSYCLTKAVEGARQKVERGENSYLIPFEKNLLKNNQNLVLYYLVVFLLPQKAVSTPQTLNNYGANKLITLLCQSF